MNPLTFRLNKTTRLKWHRDVKGQTDNYAIGRQPQKPRSVVPKQRLLMGFLLDGDGKYIIRYKVFSLCQFISPSNTSDIGLRYNKMSFSRVAKLRKVLNLAAEKEAEEKKKKKKNADKQIAEEDLDTGQSNKCLLKSKEVEPVIIPGQGLGLAAAAAAKTKNTDKPIAQEDLHTNQSNKSRLKSKDDELVIIPGQQSEANKKSSRSSPNVRFVLCR
jgi:hypothetical protein